MSDVALLFGLVDFADDFSTALLSATLMMSVVGAIAASLLARVSVHSWRIQSCLVAAVLLQGIMLVRAPVHLGWLPAPRTTDEAQIDVAIQTPIPQLSATDLPATIDGIAESDHRIAPFTIRTTSLWSLLPRIHWQTLLTLVWFLGVAVLSVHALLNYVRILRLTQQLPLAPDCWLHAWRRTARTQNMRCQMRLSQSVGPLMLRRPLGYDFIVPEAYWNDLNDDQRRGVMIHERAHLDRRDVWRQFIARAVATVHWFNPVAWWAVRRYEHAAELACDQRVAQHDQRTSAGFASALVQLVQWHQKHTAQNGPPRGLGLQAMAAPPLTIRITRLLKPTCTGDSMMKRIVLAVLAMGLVAVSLVQLRLTAEETEASVRQTSESRMYVLQEATKQQLNDIIAELDGDDETTVQLAALADSTAGEMAIAAYLGSLRDREVENARVDAVPRFLAKYFDMTVNDQYKIRPDQVEMINRWKEKSKRLETSLEQAGPTMTDMATRIDTSTEIGAMMKRLLEDPQGPAALLLFEMKGGTDVISRYISESLGSVLVDRGDGSFQIVQSRRAEAEQQVKKLEAAERIRQKLLRELPLWADEMFNSDDQHKKFVRYLQKPAMATVVSVMLIKEKKGNPALAVEKLFENLEKASVETATGLKVTDPEVWGKLEEIFGHVDRIGGLVPRIHERLAEVADTLSKDDDLAVRLAKQMRNVPLAAVLAAEMPYASADTGEQLRALLSEVMIETPEKQLKIRADKEQELGKKVTELLRVSRAIRRYVRTMDDIFEKLEDQTFVTEIGDAGRYLMLREIRRFSESQRPNPIALMKIDLLTEKDQGKLRVRDDRREAVREMIQQAEKIRAEEANDDF